MWPNDAETMWIPTRMSPNDAETMNSYDNVA